MLAGLSKLFERLGLGRPADPAAVVDAGSAPSNATFHAPACIEVRLSATRRALLLRAADEGAIVVTANARDREHAKRLRSAARALEAGGYATITREPGEGSDGRNCWYLLVMRLTPAGEALVRRCRRQLEGGREVRWRRIRAEGGLTIQN